MNEQTVYFLQALYDDLEERAKKSDEEDFLNEIKEKAAETGRLALIAERNRYLTGFLSPETIIVSDKAKRLAEKSEKLMKEIQEVRYPYELRSISNSVHKLIGEVQALLIITIRAVTSEYGANRDDIHFIVRQIAPSARIQIQHRCRMLFYRNFVLTGGKINTNAYLPDNASLRAWLDYYLNVLGNATDLMTDDEADGRWAYKLKRVTLRTHLTLDLFVKVPPDRSALTIAPGKAKIGTSSDGMLKISGRGYLTNLKPDDYDIICRNEFLRYIPAVRNYAFLSSSSNNPNKNISSILSGQKYLVPPADYFRMINKYLISRTLGLRVRQGSCIFCGSLLTYGKCRNCHGM